MSDQTILITGANRGIGLELSEQFAADGWTVLACCRNPTNAEALQALGSRYPASELQALDGVREARPEGELWTLAVTDTQRAVGSLLEHLRAREVEVDDLHTHRPTLEDVFVSITGKHLRDG